MGKFMAWDFYNLIKYWALHKCENYFNDLENLTKAIVKFVAIIKGRSTSYHRWLRSINTTNGSKENRTDVDTLRNASEREPVKLHIIIFDKLVFFFGCFVSLLLLFCWGWGMLSDFCCLRLTSSKTQNLIQLRSSVRSVVTRLMKFTFRFLMFLMFYR